MAKRRQKSGDAHTLDGQLDILSGRFEEVNKSFVDKVARQIKTIGEMNQSSINLYTIMSQMNEDMGKINAQLAAVLKISMPELFSIFQAALDDVYTDSRFERALTLSPLSDNAKAHLEHYARTVSLQTVDTMRNLSNTTVASEQYRKAVDKAVLAVSSGMQDYKSATRDVIRELGYGGMQVQYGSGYHRRLDTAVRQNVINATNQLAQHGSDLMGEQLGYDAYEITAHARSAPDHEPVQGHVFLKDQFERMQQGLDFMDIDGRSYTGFKRPIGEWNCMHLAMSFSTKYSKRKYTDQQLEQFIQDNNQGCEVDGRHYTIYGAGQLMRKIETEVRRQKDIANAARIAGDDMLRIECQKKINALAHKYAEVSNASGIKMRKDRMQVDGFKMVKVG